MRILLTGNLFHGYEYDFYEALTEMGHGVGMYFRIPERFPLRGSCTGTRL